MLLTKIIIWYSAIIILGTFVLFAIDKYLAKKEKERIPESTLLLFSALGGALGGLVAMYTLKHETKKAKFYLLLPLFLVLHIAIAILIIY